MQCIKKRGRKASQELHEFGKIIPQKYKFVLSIKKQIHSQKLIIDVLCNQPGGGGLYENHQNLSLFQSKLLITVSCWKGPQREQTTYFSTDLKFEKFEANIQHQKRQGTLQKTRTELNNTVTERRGKKVLQGHFSENKRKNFPYHECSSEVIQVIKEVFHRHLLHVHGIVAHHTLVQLCHVAQQFGEVLMMLFCTGYKAVYILVKDFWKLQCDALYKIKWKHF